MLIDIASAADLNRRFADASAEVVLETAIRDLFPGRVALVSSFGAEAAVLLALAARVDPALPVLFLNTGKHFGATLRYRDALVARLGLTHLRIAFPDITIMARDPDGMLWDRDPDACCDLRKVRPLEQALAPYDAWISGRKRHHGGERAALPVFEDDAGRIKVNPLASWTAAEIDAAFERLDLPRHPMVAQGYGSIGCAPCTALPADPDDPRSGRWAGKAKTECGIHRSTLMSVPRS